MADEKPSQDGQNASKTAAEPGKNQAPPQIQMVSQYIRDLSFENPGIGRQAKNPEVKLTVDLQASRGNDPSHYEVVMKLRATAMDGTTTMFIVELAYAAFVVLKDVPEDYQQQVLMIEVPRQIYPFARRIVADVTRDGGMVPLMLEPVDFYALYQRKLAESAGQSPAPVN